MADIRSFFTGKSTKKSSTSKNLPREEKSKSDLKKQCADSTAAGNRKGGNIGTKFTDVSPIKSLTCANQEKSERTVPVIDIIDSDDDFQTSRKVVTRRKSSSGSVNGTADDVIPPTPETKRKGKIVAKKRSSKHDDDTAKRAPKKNVADFFSGHNLSRPVKRKKSSSGDEPPLKKGNESINNVVIEVWSSGDEIISTTGLGNGEEKNKNSEVIDESLKQGSGTEPKRMGNDPGTDKSVCGLEFKEIEKSKRQLSISNKLKCKVKMKVNNRIKNAAEKENEETTKHVVKEHIPLSEEDFEIEEVLKGYMNKSNEKGKNLAKLENNLETTGTDDKSEEVDRDFMVKNETAVHLNEIMQDEINLDDSFDATELNLLPPYSESESCVSGSVMLNDSFAFDTDLEDAMIKSEEDTSIVHTWRITDIEIAEDGVKVLRLRYIGETDITATCSLQGDWFYMKTSKDDVVYVSALSKSKTHCVLNNSSKHYLVMYPNTLISGTTIASGITCERMAVLNARFNKMMGSTNKAMFLGTLTHDLFDWVLQNRECTLEDIQSRARVNLKKLKYLEGLCMVGIDVEELIEMQKEYHLSLMQWSKQFMASDGSGGSIDLKIGNEREECSTNLHIDDVVDVEENVWSPHYGFKGKIDATVEVTLHRKPKVGCSEASKKYKLPLEFKTGKLFSALGSIEHRAQVAVYTLLLSERYDIPIDFGLLLYGKTNHMIGVPRPEQEKRAILIKRNEIAQNLTLERSGLQLAPLIENRRTCERCDQNATCMLYFKSIENGNAEASGLPDLFNELTSHLCEDDTAYFAKWYELCILEAAHMDKESSDKYIWRTTSEHREKQGICFSGMKLESYEYPTGDKIFLHRFKRKEGHFNCGCSMKSMRLTCGDRVIISEENKRVYNLTTGYITCVSDDILTVSVHHEVRAITRNRPDAVYRIDKDDTLSNYTTSLCNLAELFKVNSPTDDKLRRLIIKFEEPMFSMNKSEEISNLLQDCEDDISEDSLLSTQRNALREVLSELNDVQRCAIKKCLTADDYVVVHGMPGCGKSTTIACLVRALVSVGKSVLLTSYTHSAVDTILTKLLKVGFNDFLRCGSSSRVHEEIVPYTYEEQIKSFTTVVEYTQFFAKQTVVAATCLGINHPALSSKRFDYCIVDEASQITQPVCIGPLRNADVFVLVGDHNQLPPLVLSTKAQQKGLDCSLFKSLSDLHNEAIVQLNYQYRMNADIMFLTNSLVYDNKMKCGNTDIADALLHLPLYEKLLEKNDTNQLWNIVNPKNPVVFLNTDPVKFTEEKSQSFIVNRDEAGIVKKLVTIFTQCGLSAQSIGVISMYRHQVNLLRKELEHIDGSIEVDTMDKYQGKDKSCIIISFVRSNDSLEVGELLKDWRRVNVAITRAKTKLVMIGSKNTLRCSEVLDRMLKLVELKGWCFDLTQ